MKEKLGDKKFLARREYAKFTMQESVSFSEDMEPSVHKSKYKSDKSFDKLGIMCIDNTCDSPKQEGSSQID